MSKTAQRPLQTPALPQAARVRKLPRYLNWGSWALIAGFVYLNTSLSFEFDSQPRDSLNQQLAIFALFCIVWFSWVGLRLPNAIFATVAFGPAVLVEGYGFFQTSFAALSPADLMMLVAIGLWLSQKPRLVWSKFISLAAALFGVCALSALLTFNLELIGSVARFGFWVLLVWIILSHPGHSLKKAFVDGLLLMPITALAYLRGVNGLWRFFSFGEGRALNMFSTGEVLYGSHQVIMNLVFLIPLITLLGRDFLVIPLLLTIFFYMVFSFSRSLIFATGIAFLTYLLVNIRSYRRLALAAIASLLFGGIAVTVSQNEIFNFTEDNGAKGESNVIRLTKMKNAFISYYNHPFLGKGFGSAGIISKTNTQYADQDVNPEFTPLQILAETGTLGGMLSVWLLLFAGRRCLSVLRSPSVPNYVQLALYGWIIFFITGFVGGNAYNQLITTLAFPVAAYEAFLRPHGAQRGSLLGRHYVFRVSTSKQC